MKRKWLALAVLLACASPLLAQGPSITNQFNGPNPNFWIINKTGNQGLTDTIQGPDVYCFGARQVIARLQANLGVCSLLTFDVSNNDTNWVAGSISRQVSVRNAYAANDSLNDGGRTAQLISCTPAGTELVADVGIPWRYCRLVVRRKADSGQAADATLPGRIDSLRISYHVQWTAP